MDTKRVIKSAIVHFKNKLARASYCEYVGDKMLKRALFEDCLREAFAREKYGVMGD